MARYLIPILLFLLALPATNSASEDLDRFPELDHAGVLFLNSPANPTISQQAQTPFIPASTTKLVTAWLALSHWGGSHRFTTAFYHDPNSKILWIKGSGDPFLVSAEIKLIAENLANLGVREVTRIGLDTRLFQPNLVMPGNGDSTNPYDAISTPLAANFNTIYVKSQHGQISSAEPETPITPFALVRGSAISGAKERINTGKSTRAAERYFAQLLTAFLRQNKVLVRNRVFWGKAPDTAPFYVHENSKTLGEMIKPMMQYSTNFIANQLVLMLSAEQADHPVNFVDVQDYMENAVQDAFAWQNITLKDGAGLSRDNRLSPQQLVELLDAFRPWQHLLPEVTKGIYAKSGTLNHVSTLAGYVVNRQQQWLPFAIMMPRSVSKQRRNQIVLDLVK